MTWLHDLERLRTLTTHADPRVRRWAADRWLTRHPRTDLVGLARLLLDPDDELCRDVAWHLAGTGEARWAPVLLRALELAQGSRRLGLLLALGRLGHESTAGVVHDALRQARDGRELIVALRALAGHRTEGTRKALRQLLPALQADDAMAGELARLLPALGHRADVGELVARWRQLPGSTVPGVERGMLAWLGAEDTTLRRVRRLTRGGPAAVFALHDADGLDADTVHRLDEAWAAGTSAYLRALHQATIRLLAARKDDVRTWIDQPAGLPAEDYRSLAVGVEALTEALVLGTTPAGRGHAESRLATAALLTLLDRRDERRALRTPGNLVPLLRTPHRATPTAVRDHLVALKHKAVPIVADLLRSDAPDAAVARAALLVPDLTAAGADTAPLAEPLAELLTERATGPVTAAARTAIVALGEAAVPALIDAIDLHASDDLFAALAALDTPATFDALAAAWQDAVHLDGRVITALADLGDPRALDLLGPAWQPGDTLLAGLLDALCALHDLHPPSRAAWQADLRAAATTRAAAALARAAAPAES